MDPNSPNVSDYGTDDDCPVKVNMKGFVDDETQDNDDFDREAKKTIGLPEYEALGKIALAAMRPRSANRMDTSMAKTLGKIEGMYALSSKRHAFKDD